MSSLERAQTKYKFWKEGEKDKVSLGKEGEKEDERCDGCDCSWNYRESLRKEGEKEDERCDGCDCSSNYRVNSGAETTLVVCLVKGN